MTEEPRQTATSRLPIVGTILRGYREALAKIITYGIQAAVWGATIGGAYHFLSKAAMSPSMQALEAAVVGISRAEIAEFVISRIPTLLLLAATSLAAAIVCTGVYRAAIVAEGPSLKKTFHWGQREARLFGLMLFFLAASWLGIFAVFRIARFAGAPLTAHTGYPVVERALDIVTHLLLWRMLVAIALVPNFGLAFPLAAIDVPPRLFRRSARMSSGFRWELAAISLACDMPFVFLAAVALGVFQFISGPTADVLQVVVALFILFLAGAFRAATMADAFEQVTRRMHKDTYEVFD